jgi:hypothetical protein
MEEDTKSGLMEVSMKDTGKMISLMVEGDLFMLMEIFIMAIGRMIRHMVSDNILTQMELSMKVIGKTTNNMAKEKKIGQMEHNILGIISLARKMDMENFFGLIIQVTAEIFQIIIFTERGNIDGRMVESIMVIGK